jgi:Activator of Hsp90 ATPase homolog 1-like protein
MPDQQTNDTGDRVRIERAYDAPAKEIWNLWTTPQGIESWWAPDGFKVKVDKLELKPGGELVYTMTATGPEQIEFMRGAGMPLSTESRKTFTEVKSGARLSYNSLVDFVPEHEPYWFLTVVDFERTGEGTRVIMTVDRMHDEVWTGRLIAGRENELDNLRKVLAANR